MSATAQAQAKQTKAVEQAWQTCEQTAWAHDRAYMKRREARQALEQAEQDLERAEQAHTQAVHDYTKAQERDDYLATR